MLAERRDTVVHPFTGPLAHLFARLDAWAAEQRESLRAEIKSCLRYSRAGVAGCSKRPSSKAAADESTGGVASGLR
jgi:hypothetical protein